MELILLRHGKTPSAYEAGVPSDYERPLGEIGKDQAKRAGKYLEHSDLMPERILSSPVLRARQTAERALKGLGKAVPLETHAELEPGTDTQELIKSLEGAKDKVLLLVGHQPDLGELAAWLAFGPGNPGLDLKPGGMVCLRLDKVSAKGEAKLRWLLQPDQIENLV